MRSANANHNVHFGKLTIFRSDLDSNDGNSLIVAAHTSSSCSDVAFNENSL